SSPKLKVANHVKKGGVAMTAHHWGTSLIESEYDTLEHCGIPRERASQLPWRHIDSLTGAEMFGRNGSSGQYDGLLIPNYWPGKDAPRTYRLRRAHPDLEQGADGKVKTRNKYLSAPGERNVLYFGYGTRL